jgi:hypothetical protein
MTPQESFVRPPLIAGWLVSLFTPLPQTEAISGDLVEEFSDVASRLGIDSARRWYWRHSMKTIANLFGGSFRAAPWTVVCAVVGGLLLAWYVPNWIIGALFAVCREHGVFVQKRIQFLLPLINSRLLRIVEMVLIGCIVAVAAKGSEIVTTMTVLLARIATFGVMIVWGIERGSLRVSTAHQVFRVALVMPLYFVGPSIAIVAGGLFVRLYRNSAARNISPG